MTMCRRTITTVARSPGMRRSAGCLFLLSGLLAGAGAAAAADRPPSAPPLPAHAAAGCSATGAPGGLKVSAVPVSASLVERLRRAGAEVARLSDAHGLEAWQVRPADGSPYTLYITPDGAGLLGHLFGPDGHSVTVRQLAALHGHGPSENTAPGNAVPGNAALGNTVRQSSRREHAVREDAPHQGASHGEAAHPGMRRDGAVDGAGGSGAGEPDGGASGAGGFDSGDPGDAVLGDAVLGDAAHASGTADTGGRDDRRPADRAPGGEVPGSGAAHRGVLPNPLRVAAHSPTAAAGSGHAEDRDRLLRRTREAPAIELKRGRPTLHVFADPGCGPSRQWIAALLGQTGFDFGVRVAPVALMGRRSALAAIWILEQQDRAAAWRQAARRDVTERDLTGTGAGLVAANNALFRDWGGRILPLSVFATRGGEAGRADGVPPDAASFVRRLVREGAP